MVTHPFHDGVLTIHKQTLLGIDDDGAESEWAFIAVDDRVAIAQLGNNGVHVWRVG